MCNFNNISREQALKLIDVVYLGQEPIRPYQSEPGYSKFKTIFIYTIALILFITLVMFVNTEIISTVQILENDINHLFLTLFSTLMVFANIVSLIVLTYDMIRLIFLTFNYNFPKIIKYFNQYHIWIMIPIGSFATYNTINVFSVNFNIPVLLTMVGYIIIWAFCVRFAYRYMNSRINKVISNDLNFTYHKTFSLKDQELIFGGLFTISIYMEYYWNMGFLLDIISALITPYLVIDIVFTYIKMKVSYQLLSLGKIDYNDYVKPIRIK